MRVVVFRKVVTDVSKYFVAFDEALQAQFDNDDDSLIFMGPCIILIVE